MPSMNATPSSTPLDPPAIVSALLIALGARGVPHCAINVEGFERITTHVIVKREDIRTVLSEVNALSDSGLLLVHCREYRCRAELIMAQTTEARPCIFTITVACPPGTQAILHNRERVEGIWRPRPAEEFSYLLSRLAEDPARVGPLRDHLVELIVTIGLSKAEGMTAEIFGKKDANRLFAVLEEGGNDFRVRPRATESIMERASRSLKSLMGIASNRSGLFLVMLGPDGVGKSSIKAALVEALWPIFPEYRGWHYRPRILGRIGAGRPVQAPHSMEARSRYLSLAYLSAVFADCWLGYGGIVRFLLARNSLVIFDRYFHDILIDPVRYRYGGGAWISQALSRLVPPRERMFLVLDADESIVYSRKKELPIEEIARQRKLYKAWAAATPGCYVIDTSGPMEEVVGAATQAVLEHLSQRLMKAHNLIPSRALGAKQVNEGLHILRAKGSTVPTAAESIGDSGQ